MAGFRETFAGYTFDPELAEHAQRLPPGLLEDIEVARAYSREAMAGLNADVDETGLRIEEQSVPGPAEAPPVPVRIYTSERRSATSGGILFLHGGAFVAGSIDEEHFLAAGLARGLQVVVVSVGYRLAPEHTFPAALEDCYAALRWLHEHAPTLDVDPSRVAVVGFSAGGGLSAALSLLSRDRGGPDICFQYLGYPVLDDRLDTPSMRRFVDSPLWDAAATEVIWKMYLGDHSRGSVSPYAAPARANDLSRLPPAYVSTMENDPLRDEGIIYAGRLLQVGVSAELHAFSGTWHGSGIAVPTAAVSKREANEMMLVLRRALSPSNGGPDDPVMSPG